MSKTSILINELLLIQDSFTMLKQTWYEYNGHLSEDSAEGRALKTLFNRYLDYSVILLENCQTFTAKELGPLFRATYETYLYNCYLLIEQQIPLQKKIQSFLYFEAKGFLSASDYTYFIQQESPQANLAQRIMLDTLEIQGLSELEAERVRRLEYLKEIKGSGIEKEYSRLLKRNRRRSMIQWYSLFSQQMNLKELSAYLGLEVFHQIAYPAFSLKSHGMYLTLSNTQSDVISEDQQKSILKCLHYFNDYLTEGLLNQKGGRIDL